VIYAILEFTYNFVLGIQQTPKGTLINNPSSGKLPAAPLLKGAMGIFSLVWMGNRGG
jgi:hypothetical protein